MCISIFNLMFPIKAEKMLRIGSALYKVFKSHNYSHSHCTGTQLVIPPKAPERPRSVADYYSTSAMLLNNNTFSCSGDNQSRDNMVIQFGIHNTLMGKMALLVKRSATFLSQQNCYPVIQLSHAAQCSDSFSDPESSSELSIGTW